MFAKGILLLLFGIANKQVFSLLCYSCNDVLSDEVCFNITKCPSAEVCYGRADGFLTGNVKHTTGCTKEMTPIKANGQDATTFCSTACRENLCNFGKCTKGTENVIRGPRCLSCDYVESPDDCTNITECSKGEMCYVQKFKAFSQTRYRLGCMGKQHCGQKINTAALLGKRSAPQNCSVCCSTDHCNVDACQNHNLTNSGDVYQLNSMSPDVDCQDSDPPLCVTMGSLSHEACKEHSIVRTCPKSCDTCDHVGWSSWQSWGICTSATSCGGFGTKTRIRSCLSRLSITHQQHCVGSSTGTSVCLTHCPVNGGWCYRTETYNCAGGGGIYCSSRKVKTTCSCPSPAYGGRYCS